MDVIYIAISIGFFAACFGLVALADRLSEGRS
jgi:hypothetical protein